jgi:hypothetical protein
VATVLIIARAMTTTGKNRIMIYGPKDDGTYVVEFRTAAGEALAISIPRTEAGVIRHFKSACPTGCLCRMFREEPLARPRVSLTEPSNNRPKPPA